jgi:TolB-like protein
MRALILVATAVLPLAASPAAKQKIAVLDVRAVQGVAPGTATILTAIVVDGASRGFDVISQTDVASMIGFERQRQLLGCAEDSGCLAEIGGALGVDYVLSGQVGQIGSRYHLSLQLLDARKAKVASRVARFSERDDDALAAAAQGAVVDLMAGVGGQARVTPPPRPPGAGEPSARPDRAPGPTAPASVAQARADRSFWAGRSAAWATMGAGVALAAGGLVFGLQARAARNDLADAWRRPDYASFYDRKSSEAKRDALLANVFYGAGAATAGVGVWLFTRSGTSKVTIAPLAADGTLGVVAAGRF